MKTVSSFTIFLIFAGSFLGFWLFTKYDTEGAKAKLALRYSANFGYPPGTPTQKLNQVLVKIDSPDFLGVLMAEAGKNGRYSAVEESLVRRISWDPEVQMMGNSISVDYRSTPVWTRSEIDIFNAMRLRLSEQIGEKVNLDSMALAPQQGN